MPTTAGHQARTARCGARALAFLLLLLFCAPARAQSLLTPAAPIVHSTAIAPAIPLMPTITAEASADATPAADDEPPPTAETTGVGALLRDILGDFRALPSRANVGPAIVGTGLALGAHEVDRDINSHLAGKGVVHGFFLPGKIIGQSPVQIGFGAGLYAYGRLKNHPKVTELGRDLLRAQALNAALTEGLKLTVRRERPDGSSNQSFPSGHASFTFATATVLERHFGWRVAVPTYVLASYVAVSRLHENRHFLSDVVAGAAIGYISGRTVMRRGRPSYALVPVVDRREAALLVARVW